MTDQPTTPTCAGCIGCGGPDCIERPEPMDPVHILGAEPGTNTDQPDGITAERAAHEEHRRWLASLFDLPAHADWLTVARGVTEARQLAENMQGRATAMETRATAYGQAWETAEGKLARVRALHRKANNGDTCVYCAGMQRIGYDTTWPCDTIRAIGDDQPAEAVCSACDSRDPGCPFCKQKREQPAPPLYGPFEAAADLLLDAARALRDAVTPQDRRP